MGVGFRLNLKWGLSLQPRLSSNHSSLPFSTYASFKGKHINYDLASVSLSMESEISYGDPINGSTCSSASRILDIDYSESRNIKNVANLLRDDKLTFLTSLQANKISQYRLLLQNLVALEDTFADSDVVTLEQDILDHLQKLGALKILHTSFSQIPKCPFSTNSIVTEKTAKPVVPSSRKVKRKSQRERTSRKADDDVGLVAFQIHSQPIIDRNNSRRANFSSKRLSKSRSGKVKITRNEAELSRGVKFNDYIDGC